MVSSRPGIMHVLNVVIFLVLFLVYVVALTVKTMATWLSDRLRILRSSMTSPADRPWTDI